MAAVLLAVVAPPLAAQSPAARGPGELAVVRCDPQTNTCAEDTRMFTMPLLGPSGQATVLSANLRSTELSLDAADYRFLIPGCTQAETGVYVCDSAHQYQHCRTLMFSSMVHSCRAPNPLDAGFAQARAAAPADYTLAVKSNARVKVTRGQRGFGQSRGSADVVLELAVPLEAAGGSCLQRDRFLFYPTGPEGGASEIDATAGCETPLEFRFTPHEDDIVRAHDVCENLAAWGEKIEDTVAIVAAGLFHIRSTDPDFRTRHGADTAIIAPWVNVTAPLEIDCAE
jgi:hypothetical protein